MKNNEKEKNQRKLNAEQDACINRGFTLAEVLITLVIIGVIGALTVPSLIQSTHKQEYIAKIKKAYSVVSQAYNQITAEYGQPGCNDGGWACSGTEIAKLFKEHLNVIKECPAGSGKCSPSMYYNIDGSPSSTDHTMFRGISGHGPVEVLADGMTIGFSSPSPNCSHTWWGVEPFCFVIAVDTNGAKGPNVFEKDAVMFAVRSSGLSPLFCNSKRSACNVLIDGEMNY